MTAVGFDLIGSEASLATVAPARRGRGAALLGLVVLIGWSAWQLGIGRRALVNGAGWSQAGKFFAAALHPDLAGSTVRAGWNGARVTVAYALLGTVGSALFGVPLGIVAATRWRSARRFVVPRLVRGALIPARGSHEIVWALLLLNVLGLNPLVAILAISLPFAAVTAKVVGQLLDEAVGPPAAAVRATGGRSGAVLVYGVLPLVWRDIASYLGYRFECALRAAAVLGVAGAGGLGQELRLSFLSLKYEQMWTFLFVLIALGGVADAISARLRRPTSVAAWHRPGAGRFARRLAGPIAVGGVGWAWWELGIAPSTLWSARTRSLGAELLERWFPPDVGREHLRLLFRLAGQTLAISVISALIAFAVAVPAAFLAARHPSHRLGRRAAGWVARLVLLAMRAIPPSVWAFLVVLVLFPGPMPAAVALAIYNAGVLGRLLGETVENLPAGDIDAVRRTGASALAVFAYATWPLAIRRFAVYGLYRWEVALRETIVVGIVAAGGLGQHLGSRLAAFDYPQVTAAVAAMIVLTVVVDAASARIRSALA